MSVTDRYSLKKNLFLYTKNIFHPYKKFCETNKIAIFIKIKIKYWFWDAIYYHIIYK